MKVAIIGLGFLILLSLSAAEKQSPAQRGREEFTGTANMPTFAGSAMVGPGATANITIYIDGYSSDEEVNAIAATFAQGQHKALRRALEKASVKGRIAVNGRDGFYELKLLHSKSTSSGRQIYGIGERAIRFLDAYYAGRSKLDEFGVVQLDLTEAGGTQGSGVLIRATRIQSFDRNGIVLPNNAIEPVRLALSRQ